MLPAHRLGAHMSIEGGLDRAIDRARSVHATALQVFVASSRQWSSRSLEPGEIERFRSASERCGLAPFTMAHGSYLTNLAAPAGPLRERSIEKLSEEVRRCELLGIPFLVLHPGSHGGAGVRMGLERVARALDRVLAPRRRGAAAHVRVLLETTAGQGTALGHRFEQLSTLIRRARCGDRLGVCFDTCHVLAAGYDLRDDAAYRETLREFDRHLGIDRLLAFHLNDSVHPVGSRRDRHAHIGKGEVGLAGFRSLLSDRRFRSIPMVLETPKGPDLKEDRRNLSVLRRLARGGA